MNAVSKYIVDHNIGTMRQQQQQQLLRLELTVSQILRECGKKFTQIIVRYSDGRNGRYAIGVIMSYHGWNGKDDFQASGKLLGALIALRHEGIDKDIIIRLNDSGMTFDEIADFLDGVGRPND
ncbi:MAG: hypothetical protein ACRD47_05935 [Nitrososphaeraceae archaeon]